MDFNTLLAKLKHSLCVNKVPTGITELHFSHTNHLQSASMFFPALLKT